MYSKAPLLVVQRYDSDIQFIGHSRIKSHFSSRGALWQPTLHIHMQHATRSVGCNDEG